MRGTMMMMMISITTHDISVFWKSDASDYVFISRNILADILRLVNNYLLLWLMPSPSSTQLLLGTSLPPKMAHLGLYSLHIFSSSACYDSNNVIRPYSSINKERLSLQDSPKDLLYKQHKLMFCLILPSMILKLFQNMSSISLL